MLSSKKGSLRALATHPATTTYQRLHCNWPWKVEENVAGSRNSWFYDIKKWTKMDSLTLLRIAENRTWCRQLAKASFLVWKKRTPVIRELKWDELFGFV